MTGILHVVGARPNFMKVAPIMKVMSRYPRDFRQILVHTGQHYDSQMSRVFFDELDMQEPDIHLGVGSGSHAWQTAQVMQRFEPVVKEHKPDWVILVGDVNSTLACALVCAKMGVPMAHVEAGLRSFDRSMPEEINRVVTDQVSDLLFTSEEGAHANLVREGVLADKIHFVGNVMIDTLVHLMPRTEDRAILRHLNLLDECDRSRRYLLVTLHRPGNVDERRKLGELVRALEHLAGCLEVVFPLHPRTRQRLSEFGMSQPLGKCRLVDPLGYIDFLALQRHAAIVLTDSGGVQEETTYLGVPCLTVRPNTERPVTISHGTNRLVACEYGALVETARRTLNGGATAPKARPPLWDGRAAERIVEILRVKASPEEATGGRSLTALESSVTKRVI